MEIKNLKNDRKRFFGLLGKGALGLTLLSSLPIKLFGSSNSTEGLKKVKLHPAAVKRTK